jgi:hypothetical protein
MCVQKRARGGPPVVSKSQLRIRLRKWPRSSDRSAASSVRQTEDQQVKVSRHGAGFGDPTSAYGWPWGPRLRERAPTLGGGSAGLRMQVGAEWGCRSPLPLTRPAPDPCPPHDSIRVRGRTPAPGHHSAYGHGGTRRPVQGPHRRDEGRPVPDPPAACHDAAPSRAVPRRRPRRQARESLFSR